MPRQFFIATLILPIVLIVLWLIFRGATTGAPPGQKGLRGTGLATSRKLWVFEMTLLVLFLCFCLMAIYWHLV